MLASAGSVNDCDPISTCASCTLEGHWQVCSHCLVSYYCSSQCRKSHRLAHEQFCNMVHTKRHFVELGIYSIRQLVQEGNDVRVNFTGEILLSVGRYEHPSALLEARDSMICPALKVSVYTDGNKGKQQLLNAAFSISSPISVISERLAKRIGLKYSTDVVDVISPRCWKREAYLPINCLVVACASSVVSFRNNAPDKSYLRRPALQVAPLVCPDVTVDLLLGWDWFRHFGEKTSVLYSPGCSRIRCSSGLQVSLPWDRLDCRPDYNKHTSYMDHIVQVSADVLARLETIRGYTCVDVAEVHRFQGGLMDSVMCQHDFTTFTHERPEETEMRADSKGKYEEKEIVAKCSSNCSECPWEEHLTPEGDVYFFNTHTGESSWEKPEH